VAGGVATTFELFTHEWLRNLVRVAAAQEARSASAAVSAARASSLGVFSRKTGWPDGMGMNISGGFQKLQQDAANLKISAQDKVDADQGKGGDEPVN